MKATLSFNLDDFTDRSAHKRALNGTNAYLVLFELQNTVFRNVIKYNGDNYSEETLHAIDEIRSKLNDLMERYEVNLNDLE